MFGGDALFDGDGFVGAARLRVAAGEVGPGGERPGVVGPKDAFGRRHQSLAKANTRSMQAGSEQRELHVEEHLAKTFLAIHVDGDVARRRERGRMLRSCQRCL